MNAAQKGWITRRRNKARQDGAPVIKGSPLAYSENSMVSAVGECATCGENLIDKAILQAFTAPSLMMKMVTK